MSHPFDFIDDAVKAINLVFGIESYRAMGFETDDTYQSLLMVKGFNEPIMTACIPILKRYPVVFKLFNNKDILCKSGKDLEREIKLMFRNKLVMHILQGMMED